MSTRPHSLVVADSSDSITKYYKLKTQWQQEKSNLDFISQYALSGASLGCAVPHLIDSSEEVEFATAGYTYRFSNTMGRIHGHSAEAISAKQNPQSWVPTMATAIYNLHAQSRSRIVNWTADHGSTDALLLHILSDKADGILRQNPDAQIRQRITEMAQYLRSRVPMLAHEYTLSHQDINLSNILIDEDNKLAGIVDWVTFGFTHPSLSMYQVATDPGIWKIFQGTYIQQGGTISFDILYAASAIHNAWAEIVWRPLIAKDMDMPDADGETMERFDEMYKRFKASKIIFDSINA